MTEPAIAVLPYGGRLGRAFARQPLDDLHWPLGRPTRLAQGVVGDLTRDDHLIVYPKTAMHFQLRWGVAAHVSMMVVEPEIIHARHLKLLRWTHRRFYRVLSHNDALLASIPNGILHPFGTTWIDEHAALKIDKTQNISLIASSKRDTEGHVLRHEVVDAIKAQGLDVAVLGRGYAPFADKADGLAPFRFSVVIENMRERNYFTEKIVDAVLCETVPIYWGCPNVAEFFDPDAIIACETKEDLLAALKRADAETYAAMRPALLRAKAQADHWADLEGRAARAIRDTL
ncbi:glycosyltransferase family 10 domain-containing protein [Sulfitobacter sp. JB4-11]|uniref:glycosyltransferase family 10 domain-containing protein n=1 Tax=Sulfitobacter rhodophyticola TaxID=3238304 RepID=UPI0035176CD6